MASECVLTRGMPLFDHPVLDWMSRVHPLVPALFWGTGSATILVVGIDYGVSGHDAALLFFLGCMLWAFTEYCIHRWIFHFQPKTRRTKRFYYYVHEHHHRYQEWDRLLAPPLVSLPIFLLLLLPFYLGIGLPFGIGPMCVVLAGFGAGYLGYDYTHLYTHFATPSSHLGRYLRRCHLQHHFSRPDRWFGVSCPWVDYLMGTHLQRDEQRGAAAVSQYTTFTDADLPPKVRAFERARTRGEDPRA